MRNEKAVVVVMHKLQLKTSRIVFSSVNKNLFNSLITTVNLSYATIFKAFIIIFYLF